MPSIIQQIKERKIPQTLVIYLGGGWVLIEALNFFVEKYGWNEKIFDLFIIIAIFGLPTILIHAWFHGKSESRNIQKREILLHAIIILLASAFIVNILFKPYEIEAKSDNQNVNPLEKSIAVLAFTDMSPNQDQEYFSDGISEELLNLLAKIPELRVISRTSSFSYKDKNMALEKIGEELNVTHILEGSVRKSGDKLRITTQLIVVTDGSNLWSETYNFDLKDIFEIQDEIAEAVIRQLKVTLLGDIPKTKKVNLKAYNLYLEALYTMHSTWTMEATLKTESILNRSIAIDSTYAPSWNLLGDAIFASTTSFYTKPYREGLELAKAAMEKSIGLDNTYAMPYVNLSLINSLEWDFDKAQDNVNLALKLSKEDYMVLVRAADHSKYSGKFDDAIEFLQQAFKLEPLARWIDMQLGMMYYYSGDLDEASNAMQKIIYLRPEGEEQHIFMSLILIGQGKNIEALENAEKEPVEYWKIYALAHAIYALGRQDASDSLLGQFIDNHSKKHPSLVASIYAHRAEHDYAFKWLEIAFEQRDGYLVEVINVPFFENLYKDPRWDIFIARMNLPKDHWLLLRND